MLGLAASALLLILAYLLGSIPTGYLAGRWLKGIDIREQGSGSTGATNVLRTLGKVPAVTVLIIDALKGAAAIALVRGVYGLETFRAITTDLSGMGTSLLPWMLTLAGLLAILGHSKPVWIGFKGGKSVATSLGVLLALSWQVGLATLGVFLGVLALSRIVSLSSILAAIAVGGWMYGFAQPLPYLLFAIAGGLYVIERHRGNIQRLMAGTEPRLGQKLPQENQS
ncbi:glycerol-3-phosphate acyltransferase [Neosynechococcus sphagnicola sy1]|uniref:Glycerol-3-phosphate acyltransferase n=1 Tax=Neosynechococcus sphagnicola sy1 TaxID=1497020 RepID=A0A098TSZ3_9CYAN|nr:glycerol-3-phosphate 1-O-acyltransferase PlsY [Neosynechococcus sphagnicola]KGF73898.1 glycerol-3-phosphate acyltransferase [Neosynechococcus sphagnicola sy1]